MYIVYPIRYTKTGGSYEVDAMKYAVSFAVAACLLSGCGSGGGDDTTEDNRVCIVNDSFNNEPQNDLAVTDQAEQAGLDVVDNANTNSPTGKSISICGNPVDINAAIGDGSLPDLSQFLASGTQKAVSDSEEQL